MVLLYCINPQESDQSKDTVTATTPPPQEEFPSLTVYAEGLGPDAQVVQGSPEVEEHSSISVTEQQQAIATPLDIPAINVVAGTPPLSILETARVMEQNELANATNDLTDENDDEVVLASNISLTEVASSDNKDDRPNSPQRHTVRRQGSERKGRSRHARDDIVRRRSMSSERPTSSSTKSNAPSSERLSRRSIDVSSFSSAKQFTAREKSPERRNVTANKSLLSNNAVSCSDSEDEQATMSSQLHKKSGVESKSLTSSKSSGSLSMAEERHAISSDQPPCAVGEKVMVDTPNGFKFAKIKFIGPTEFAQGEWIGVALERPAGEFIMGNVVTLLLLSY